jgi:arylsulfatase A
MPETRTSQALPYFLSVSLAFIAALPVLFRCDTLLAQRPATPAGPNIVVILCDDLGYGDLGCYGHPVIHTPHTDRLAREGQRWTSFYASSSVCNPSRVALMTGRLPIRIQGGDRNRWANLPAEETTIAELLKSKGYATGCIGKWHLGMGDGMHPNDQGFDYFYGTPGSNDAPLKKGIERTYESTKNATIDMYDIPLLRQRESLENPLEQTTITKRYAEEAVQFIHRNKDHRFFLYLSHNMPHVPLFRSKKFEGKSAGGLYGDVIEEIDWSVGQILSGLEEHSLSNQTLVVFTSDNGPWRTYYDLGGSAGPLRDGKMTAWEGGFRVPGIFWWPGTIRPSVVRGIGVNVDLIATFATLTGAQLPTDRAFDAIDLSPTLLEGKPSARDRWFYYGHPSGALWAARLGPFKMHLESWETIGHEKVGRRGYGNYAKHEPPLLFDLGTDVMESLNVAQHHAAEVQRIQQAISKHRASLK